MQTDVQAVQRQEIPGRQGWFARVVLNDGADTLNVSRLDGETAWTVDARFRGSLPVFVNGYGARYVRTDRIADAGIIATLDSATGFDAALGEGRR